MNKNKIMKQLLTFLAVLFCLSSYSQGNWTLTGTRNRWGNGMGFSSKSEAQLAGFVNASDSNLVQWSREDSTLAIRGSIYAPWRKLTHSESGNFIKNQSSSTQIASYKISDTGWAVKLLRSNKGLIDSIQASGSGGGYLVTNSGAAVAHWGGGGSVEVDFKGFAGYDANRSASYTDRSFTDKRYVDSIRTVIGDTLSTRVRLQTGTAFQEVGKIRVSDTIRTAGYMLASNLLTVSTTSAQALSGNNTSTGRGLFAQAVGNNAAFLQNTSNDSSAVRIVNNGNAEIASFENSFGDVAAISNDGGLQQFNQGSGFWGRTLPTTLSANRTYTLPNASGTIALTSNISDSSSALRASINTKLNISDTSAMLNGNYLRLTGGTLTGALSGTSGTFSSGLTATGGNVTSSGTEPYLIARGTTNNSFRGIKIFGQTDGNTEFASSMANFTTGEFRHVAGFATYGGIHTWYTNGTEKMRLTDGGSVGIGTTSPAYKTVISPVTAYTAINTGDGLQIEGATGIGTGSNMILGIASSGSIIQSRDGVSVNNLALNPFGGRLLVGTTTDDGSSIGQFNGNVLATGNASSYPRFISTVGAKSWEIGYRSGTTAYEVREDGTTQFAIANGGAATFSSSVTANGKLYAKDVSTGSSSDSVLVKANDGEVKKVAQTTVTSGTYTPTLSSSSNISSPTVQQFVYSRSDSVVTVSGAITFTVTANTTSTSFQLTLPIASNLTGNYDLNGVGSCNSSTATMHSSGYVQSSPSTDTALINFISNGTGFSIMYITFQYIIR